MSRANRPFSYDYSIQRPHWPMPHAVRVKVAIAEELDVLRGKVLGPVSGSPGQQLLVSQLLTRRIADEKLRIADQDGLLSGRADVAGAVHGTDGASVREARVLAGSTAGGAADGNQRARQALVLRRFTPIQKIFR